jgi:hypothetical protein
LLLVANLSAEGGRPAARAMKASKTVSEMMLRIMARQLELLLLMSRVFRTKSAIEVY